MFPKENLVGECFPCILTKQLPTKLLRKVWIHPWNLTWNLKIMVSKWTFLLQGLIYRFHVKLRGCMFSLWIVSWGLLRVYLIHIQTWSVQSPEKRRGIEEMNNSHDLLGGGFKYCLCSPLIWGNESIWRAAACFWNGLKLPTSLALDLVIGWFAFQGCLGSWIFSLTRDDVGSSMYGI